MDSAAITSPMPAHRDGGVRIERHTVDVAQRDRAWYERATRGLAIGGGAVGGAAILGGTILGLELLGGRSSSMGRAFMPLIVGMSVAGALIGGIGTAYETRDWGATTAYRVVPDAAEGSA